MKGNDGLGDNHISMRNVEEEEDDNEEEKWNIYASIDYACMY